ncbi:Clavaminate synthase-like protein [Aulographum hederae CBS 113979]|uniref:Clavaminate synthase-like protein n=1 Tax=Aulographum hederae CBS 113979 TaxID=1176131 RepID=A0A6G1HAU1_9PEZI|nr:Clavaminate synthase-like protein [Aulographum hederae CBS 113979]
MNTPATFLERVALPYVLSDKSTPKDVLTAPNSLSGNVPLGFPSSVHSPQTWTATDVEQRPQDWILALTSEEAYAIDHAVQAFIDSKAPLPHLNRDTFDLPRTLSDKLDLVSEACYLGPGFCILRGLNSSARTEEENAILFAGVSSHVASSRGFQDIDKKHVLAHLFKKHRKEFSEYIPPSFNSFPIAFHTDDGDIVALYYASVTERGGRTLITSQSQVYNELAETRPDLLQILAEDWLIDTYFRPDAPPRCSPLLHPHGNGDITIQYSRLPFSRYDGSRAQRADMPPLTDLQIDALNHLQVISNKHAFAAPTQAGDILYFNNVSTFHAREKYEDSATSNMAPQHHDRHLLRLWLLDPKRTSPLAPSLQKIWDEVFAKDREELWCVKAVDAFAMNADKNG